MAEYDRRIAHRKRRVSEQGKAKRIVEKYGREVFSFDDGMIKVSIPLAYDREEVTERKKKAYMRKGLTKNQEQVLDYLKNNPMATLQEAASGCELSLGGVKKICLRLQEIGVLEREGSKSKKQIDKPPFP